MKKILSALFIFLIIFISSCSKDDGGGVISPPPPNRDLPTACFNASPEMCEVDDCTITFNADCSEEETFYQWDFNNDGTIDVEGGDKKEVTHTYTEVGTYTVKLIAVNSAGMKETTRTLEVKTAVVPPSISFDVSTTECTIPCEVCITNVQALGDIVEYAWDFGDGTMENGSELPSEFCHTYDEVGDFTFSLKATGPNGDFDNKEAFFVINPAPSFDIVLEESSIEATAIAETKDNEYVVVGRSLFSKYGYLLRINNKGETIAGFPKIDEDSNQKYDYLDVDIAENGDFLIVSPSYLHRRNNNGNTINGFPKRIPDGAANAIIELDNGDIIIGGKNKIWRYNSSGSLYFGFPKTILGMNVVASSKFIKTPDGNLAATGGLNGNILLYKFDVNAELLNGYPKHYNTVNEEAFGSAISLSPDGFLIGGSISTTDNNTLRVYEPKKILLKVDFNGVELSGFPLVFDAPIPEAETWGYKTYSITSSIAEANNGNIAITGFYNREDSNCLGGFRVCISSSWLAFSNPKGQFNPGFPLLYGNGNWEVYSLNDLITTNDGGFIMVGKVPDGIWIKKTDANGQ